MTRLAPRIALALLCLALLCLALGAALPARGESVLALDGPADELLAEGLAADAAGGEEAEAAEAADDAELQPYRGPQGIRPAPRPGGRPLTLYRTASVESLIRYFTERRREVVERGWRRSGRYLPMIRRVLREEGVPEALAYLAAVESNFNPLARSPARAVGLWQFTAPTARAFGLRIHRPWYDERLDPEAATHAAARLLAYLYDRYGNWELALAAYNAGEARVNAAIARARRAGRPADYWNLRLPRQTRGFVPAFLAIAAIMEAPAAHGLEAVARDAPLESVGLEIELSATLDAVAERLQLPAAALRERNLAWRRGLMPPLAVGPVLLRLPPGSGPRLLASLAERPPDEGSWWVHTVREGETVSHIALRYGVRTGDMLALNRLRWNSLLSIGQPVLVPVGAEAGQAIAATDPAGPGAAAADGAGPPESEARLHRVQSGESLWSIAQRYGVRMTELRLWNRLGDPVLQPDQELVVYVPADWTAVR
jgi:membrane-bound lytic murein transglycosylase D